MKFSELEIPGKFEIDQDPYSFVGEPDSQGNIVFVRHYRNDPNWKRKSKPLKIPASIFWGTSEAVKNGTYKPRKVTCSRVAQLALTSKIKTKKSNKK